MAESLLGNSNPSEAEKYIKNIKLIKNPDSSKKAKAFAQGILDLLKPIDQGGNMSMDEFSSMMEEVQKRMDEEGFKKSPKKGHIKGLMEEVQKRMGEKFTTKKGSSSKSPPKKGHTKKSFDDKGRVPRQEGGILVPPEMEMEATAAPAAPVDTYPNIPPEEMAEVEASQLPDEQMEDDYVDFVMNEALDPEEQTYLMNVLEADPQLSMIFDKVVDTASEFSGAGEVTGPGDGVSDSIPARLSDGEFVVTKKATDQLGADNLQTMMDEAERAFDGGLMSRDRGIEDEEIKKSMFASNQMPSLNVRQR